MANLSQLIEAAVEAWRDGRSGAALDTAAVQVEVIGGDGETLAEARVTLREG